MSHQSQALKTQEKHEEGEGKELWQCCSKKKKKKGSTKISRRKGQISLN